MRLFINMVAINGSVRPSTLTWKKATSCSIGGSNEKRCDHVFAGEVEVGLVDPSRIRFPEAVGCTVAT